MTIQKGFQLLGNITAGHLADLFGRKILFFLFIAIMTVSNLLTHFGQMGHVDFLPGNGIGCFLTTQYNFLSEFCLRVRSTSFIGLSVNLD